MAVRDRGVYNGGGGFRGRFAVGVTLVAGEPLMASATEAAASEAIPCTTTSATDFLGVALEAVTYSTTQADFTGFPGYRQSGEEGTVGITFDPLQVVKFRASGSAVTGTALGAAVILTNSTADATGLVISDATIGTADRSGGLICGRTGNNAGIVRKQTSFNSGTDTNVVVPFPNTIAADDTFICVPWSKHGKNIQLTATDLLEANALIDPGTGAEFAIVDVEFDIIADEVAVYGVARDHYLNAFA